MTSIQDPIGVPLTVLVSLASAIHVPLALLPAAEPQPHHCVIFVHCISTPWLNQGCDLFILGGSGTLTVSEVVLLLHLSCSSGQRSKVSRALGQRLRSWSLASPFEFLVPSTSPSFPPSSCAFWVCSYLSQCSCSLVHKGVLFKEPVGP